MKANSSGQGQLMATPTWRQERRLAKLAREADMVRGTVMNFAWLDRSQKWLDYHDKVCGREDCGHGKWNLKLQVPQEPQEPQESQMPQGKTK